MLSLLNCKTIKKVEGDPVINWENYLTTPIIVSTTDSTDSFIADSSGGIFYSIGTVLWTIADPIPIRSLVQEPNLSFVVKLYTSDKDSISLKYQLSTSLDKDVYSVTTTTKDSVLTVINKNYFGRSFADDGSNVWSYVVPPQLDVEMCDYCLRFIQNNTEILYKPNGQILINGVLKQTSISQYYDVLYMLISLNNK